MPVRRLHVAYLTAVEAEELAFWGVDTDDGWAPGVWPICGRTLVEEPAAGGAMFFCVPAVSFGEQPPPDATLPATHWFWVDNRAN